MSILQMAYMHSDATHKPSEILHCLLDPYYITWDQVQNLISLLCWPGRLSASIKHPAFLVVQRLEKYQQAEVTTKSEALKKYFICAATFITHLWYTKYCETRKKYILADKPFGCIAYEYSDAPVPFAWISFDYHGVPHVMKQHPRMPPVEIHLFRSTKMGALHPLNIKLFESSCFASLGFSQLVVHTFNETFLGIESVEPNHFLPNYMLIVSEERLFCRCLLVSPSVDKLWSMPVLFHLYE